MAKVLVLPDHVASQIAAGEVVERPASVAKELIENAIDAGATSINISVSEGCRSIRVADNGCGMDADDAVLAFHRHATSKLRAADDLWRLSSLGFRGEALPSIASVAKVTCYTRRRESATGLRIEAMDGKLNAVETGCASGTVMEVVDLFYNVPARLNFLKKAATEFAHILEVAQNLAIAYPEISFELLKNNEKSLRTSGSGQLEQAIREVGFISIRDSLIAVSGSDFQHGLSVSGYIASPLHFRGDRKAILSIVNRRPVRCPLTYKALEYAYSDLIPRGRHPLAVLIVTLDAADLDVNIHPTKKEIKYSHGNEVYLTIQRAIMDALRQHGVAKTAFSATAVPEVESSFKSFSEDEYVRVSDRSLASDRSLGAASILVDTATPSFEASPKIVGEPSAVKPQQLGFKDRLVYFNDEREDSKECESGVCEDLPTLPLGWRYIGYLNNTYILLETDEGLEIVEQHIAHERTLYERILANQRQKGRICDQSQQLLISEPLQLTGDELACLRENASLLFALGFEFEHTADGSVVCTQVPLELAHRNYAAVVQELLSQLLTCQSANLELEATKSLACQAAIKNGMPLSTTAIIKLLSEWANTPRNDTCPHGRPVRLQLSMDKLFQMFHPQ